MGVAGGGGVFLAISHGFINTCKVSNALNLGRMSEFLQKIGTKNIWCCQLPLACCVQLPVPDRLSRGGG